MARHRPHAALAFAAIALVVGCSVRPAPIDQPSQMPSGSGAATATIRPTASPRTIPSSAPTTEPTGAWSPTWSHNVVCDELDPDADPAAVTPCRAVLFGPDGYDLATWSVDLDGPCPHRTTAPSGILFVACNDGLGARIHAIDIDGRSLPGWPVEGSARLAPMSWLDDGNGCGAVSPSLVADSSDNLYVATPGGAGEPPLLQSLDRAGRPRPGWPQPLPGDGSVACAGFAVTNDGSIRAWGYEGARIVEFDLDSHLEAERTVISAFGSEGSVMPGWPIVASGAAYGPRVTAAGTTYHVTVPTGVWAHDASAEVITGWPYALYPADADFRWAVTPYLAPDGRLVFLSIRTADDVLALGADGQPIDVWPPWLGAEREVICIYDMDCFGFVEPAFGPDGVLYVGLRPDGPGQGGSVVALDPTGQVVAGWPVQLAPRTRVTSLAYHPHGMVLIGTTTCETDDCVGEAASDVQIVTPEGEPFN